MKTVVTSSVRTAAKYIFAGEPVGFPTETVYGLGANVYDERAVRKIFKIKGRPSDNPLIVHISRIEQIYGLADTISNNARLIIEKFFPGPVTIVVKKNSIISDIVTAGLDTIAIRMPQLELSRKFIEKCGVPLAAPSANISGSPSPTSWRHVYHDLYGRVSCILKGPKSKVGIESTVIDCSGKIPVILRPGIVTANQIRKIIPNIKAEIKSLSKFPKSPGMKYKHYSPKARVIIIKSFNEIPEDILNNYQDKIGYIGIDPCPYRIRKRIVKNEIEYSHHLFNFFRLCDKHNLKMVFCQEVKNDGVGMAIMNRLNKAANE